MDVKLKHIWFPNLVRNTNESTKLLSASVSVLMVYLSSYKKINILTQGLSDLMNQIPSWVEDKRHLATVLNSSADVFRLMANQTKMIIDTSQPYSHQIYKAAHCLDYSLRQNISIQVLNILMYVIMLMSAVRLLYLWIIDIIKSPVKSSSISHLTAVVDQKILCYLLFYPILALFRQFDKRSIITSLVLLLFGYFPVHDSTFSKWSYKVSEILHSTLIAVAVFLTRSDGVSDNASRMFMMGFVLLTLVELKFKNKWTSILRFIFEAVSLKMWADNIDHSMTKTYQFSQHQIVLFKSELDKLLHMHQ